MPETGRISYLPVKYRMLLALSVALLIHTLIVASLSLLVTPKEQPQNSSLNVILVRSGHSSSAVATAITPAAPTPKLRPTSQPVAPTTPQPTSRTSPDSVPEANKPTVRPEPLPQRPKLAQPEMVDTQPGERQGKHSPLDGQADASITQVTPPTSRQPPSYTDTLVLQIAKEAGRETLKIPNQAIRQRLKPLQLELKLMPNGTLVRADIIKSTGVRAYDKSILKAALRASPFPEPPGDARASGLRFRIDFYLQPGR